MSTGWVCPKCGRGEEAAPTDPCVRCGDPLSHGGHVPGFCIDRRDPTSGRVPTEAMYEHARRLSKERNWKDVQP